MDEKTAKRLHPETLMMGYGYKPELSEGALKAPIFQTSTFVFRSAEEGKEFFELAYGQREKGPTEEIGLIYSRINNPDVEILENRLAVLDGAEEAAAFESGLAAISTVLLEFLKPGDLLLHSRPIYGGTDHFITHVLTRYGINVLPFTENDSIDDIRKKIKDSGYAERLSMIYVETPGNPTCAMIDLEMCVQLAKEFSTKGRRVVTAVDNTFLGPMWQHPLQFGIDLVIYSATKYIGGHSDLVAGSCAGTAEYIKRIKTLRTFLGNMADAWTGWLLMRSLETLKVRMDCQARNAEVIAGYLQRHPMVEKIYYPGLLKESCSQFKIFKKQCTNAGAMITFDIKGGRCEAYKFLNSLKVVRLAVSLGGTESLAEHPGTMTHIDVDPEERRALGISDKMVRLSVGIENVEDLIWDLDQALAAVSATAKSGKEAGGVLEHSL
ncbi:MAG TPA: cystathionine gamma-synthase family protein [Bacteroidota bacterium]